MLVARPGKKIILVVVLIAALLGLHVSCIETQSTVDADSPDSGTLPDQSTSSSGKDGFHNTDGEVVAIDPDFETDDTDSEIDTDNQDSGIGTTEEDVEETLPPSLSYYFNLQFEMFERRKEKCGLSDDGRRPSIPAEHLTTRLEYARHLSCLEEIESRDCAMLGKGDLRSLTDCLFAEPTVYDALDPPEVCPFTVDELTFDHRRREFSLHNAYWLLWMAWACELGDEDAILGELASRGFSGGEIVKQKRLTVAIVEQEEFVVFAFKGNTKTSDYLSDAAFIMDDTSNTGLPGKVHSPFHDSLELVWPSLRTALENAAQNGKTIIFSGHSMGGSCSQMAAYKAHQAGIEIAQIYNFAAPRTGDKIFAKAFESVFEGRFFRVNNGLDLAPHVPPSAAAEQTAKEAILDVLGDVGDPGVPLEKIEDILDLGFQIAAFTHAGDAYAFDVNGYLLSSRAYSDADEIPYWENLRDLFVGDTAFDMTSETAVLSEYHDASLQLCYQARAVGQLFYDRDE